MDNVFIERVWRSLKYEEVHLKSYAGGGEARAGAATQKAISIVLICCRCRTIMWSSRCRHRSPTSNKAEIERRALGKARRWRMLSAQQTATGGATMFSFTLRRGVLAGGIVVGLIWATATVPTAALEKASPPDFSSNQVGWIPIGGDFIQVPGGPPLVSNDPVHPYIPNGIGAQPTYRIADLSNPNLKPWAKERMKKDNDEVLSGKIGYTPRSSCMPAGVPVFMTYSRFQPIYFLQSPKEVLIIFSGDQQVRHVYLDVPHSEHLTPSWYGESVGHLRRRRW